MTLKEIQELIRLITKTNLTEFKMKDGEFELTIRTEEYHKSRTQPTQVVTPQSVVPVATPAIHTVPQSPAAASGPAGGQAPPKPAEEDVEKPAPKESSQKYIEVKSPMVGTFYRSPSPDKSAYVQVGDIIEKGSVVCIIEAMKLFNEIESEVSGKIVKVLVDDAQPVEYDQPLFLVDPS